jgi:hypothetical protein
MQGQSARSSCSLATFGVMSATSRSISSVDCDRHTLSGHRLLAVRLLRPQRQLVVPRGKSGRDHDELSQLICDRSIMGFAIAQQFYSGAWRSRASDDRVTRSPNECNVEDRHDLIAAIRRGGRDGKCGCHRESVGSCISNARCRWRNRCCCGSGFNWRLPFARETRDKCRTTCGSKREKRDGYSAYRYGGHGRQPVAKSLARQHPLKSMVRRIGAGNQAAHPDPCSLRSNPEKVWRFWRRCAGPRRG